MNLREARHRFDDERGVVAVTVALLMVVLMGSAAMTFDLARLRHERHLIQAAVDLGSLAGAGFLPVSDVPGAAAAEAAARDVAVKNAPELATSGLTMTFACVVSAPVSADFSLGFACGPGTGTWTGGWTTRAGKAIHSCNPYIGDLCNTIQLSASSTVDYYFAPFLGFSQGNTGAVRAAACRGFCGQASSPLDVVLLIDRTASMSPADIANVKDAIVDTSPAEDSMLEFYDPDDVYIGLVALPYKNQSTCNVGVASPQDYRYPALAATIPLWQVVPLSNDYRLSSGGINPGSTLVSRIQCLQRAGSPTVRVNGSTDSHGHTNHAEPMIAAQAMLSGGRPDAPDVIVFFADGESNQPYGVSSPCSYTNTVASTAKAAGTTIFSLGYGASDARCQYDFGTWRNLAATTFLARVASPTTTGPSTDNLPLGCAADENTDGDFYFCESRGEDLSDVFRIIAIQSIQRSRLLNF